ncbi:hypothetical protein D9M71_474010 [compost metagenome]
MPQQAALGLVFTQDGVRKHRRGNHPLRQIVEPFESAPSGNGHFTGSEQPFQRMLFRAPVPPGAGPFLTGRQAAGPQRALLLDRRQHPANCVLLLTTEARQLLINVLATSGTLHAPAHQREHGKWQQRGFMPPILEQRTTPALTPGSLVEQIGGVVTEAGKQRKVVRTHQCIDRIDLQNAQPFDQAIERNSLDRRWRRPPVEPLGGQRQTPSLFEGKGQRCGHGCLLVCSQPTSPVRGLCSVAFIIYASGHSRTA